MIDNKMQCPGCGHWFAAPPEVAALSTLAAVEASEPSPTQAEWEEMAYRFCCLLDHVTGGRMSKPNYELSIMKAVADDHMNEVVEDAIKEALDTPQEAAASVQGPSLLEGETYSFAQMNEIETAAFIRGRDAGEKYGRLFATPVVQGEPVAEAAQAIENAIDRILACVNAKREPRWSYRNTITTNRELIREQCRILRAARATPAPSPKVPIDVLIKRKERDHIIGTIRARCSDSLAERLAAVFEIAIAQHAALATRGPIGAVEPVTDDQIDGAASTVWEDYEDDLDRLREFARTVLALSRTPGAGNAD